MEEPHSPGLPLIRDPDEEPTEVRPTLTPPAAQADNAGVTPAVPADLLEEHVLPALVARGLVSSAAQIEWEDEGANPDAQLMTPGDGLADRRPVRVTGRRGTAGRAVERTTPTRTGTRVEVTIDRIEIITQPAPPPPPPVGAVPRRPQVDHADYRARRRQGRS